MALLLLVVVVVAVTAVAAVPVLAGLRKVEPGVPRRSGKTGPKPVVGLPLSSISTTVQPTRGNLMECCHLGGADDRRLGVGTESNPQTVMCSVTTIDTN